MTEQGEWLVADAIDEVETIIRDESVTYRPVHGGIRACCNMTGLWYWLTRERHSSKPSDRAPP
jgi:hypothetical protein